MRCVISEYTVVQVVFKDEQCLLQSLKDIGFKPVVHEKGITLSNSYSRARPTAHIVVSRSQVGGYGDLGFERTNKGFKMHVDGTFKKLKQLNQTYVENKVKQYVNSTSSCNIFSRHENDKGQIEIQLRITD